MDDVISHGAMPRIREGFAAQRLVRRSGDWRRTALNAPISREFCITDIGHFPETRFHWVDRRSGTKEHILIYNRAGTGRAFIGDRSWTVSSDHILVIPKNLPHSYGADESTPWNIYWFHFDGKSAKQILNLLKVTAKKPLLAVGQIDGLLPIFESTLEIASQCFNPEDAPILSEHLLHIANTLRKGIREKDRPNPRIDPRIEAAMDFMRANLHRSCSLEEIARTVGLSVPQFSNLFRSHTGTSPMRFFTRWRMHRAAHCLTQSSDSVSAIAERIGYDDSFYFCRVFRQYVGISPRRYRQHLREMDSDS